MDLNAQVCVPDTAYQVKYSAMQNWMKMVAREKITDIQKIFSLRGTPVHLNVKLIANLMKSDAMRRLSMVVQNVIIVFPQSTQMV